MYKNKPGQSVGVAIGMERRPATKQQGSRADGGWKGPKARPEPSTVHVESIDQSYKKAMIKQCKS